MRVLVACEFSGRVRDAFLARGHDAISCDLLPTEAAGPHHQGDVLAFLARERFDLMIAHPPCTYLTASGLHWNSRRPGRSALTESAIAFVRALLAADVPRIALENPIGCISSRVRAPDQVVHPWQFGTPESKATCLWLKGLPKLEPGPVCEPSAWRTTKSGRRVPQWNNQTPSGQNKLGPSDDRWKVRSLTVEGLARAMAEQWGRLDV